MILNKKTVDRYRFSAQVMGQLSIVDLCNSHEELRDAAKLGTQLQEVLQMDAIRQGIREGSKQFSGSFGVFLDWLSALADEAKEAGK